MYWLIIATLFGAFAGHVIGYMVAAVRRNVRGVDEITWYLATLAGMAIGLVFGLLLDSLAAAEKWPRSRQTLIKSIGVLSVLFVLWILLLPALNAAR